MNRRLTLLMGVMVLGFTHACDRATTAASTTNLAGPSFQWEALPPPPTLTVSIEPDANNPPRDAQGQSTAGDYTFHANVSGGSGSYTYRWYWAGCNINDNQEWCPNGFFDSHQGGTSFTTYVGLYDTRLEVVVEVQDNSCANPPSSHCSAPSGKAWILTEGPQWGWVPQGFMPCLLGPSYPLWRWEFDTNGVLQFVEYRRHPCTGAFEYTN
jgi:hypothetical protein